METLMNGQSPKSQPETSPDIHRSTCSQESGDGAMPCDLPDGPTLDLFGQDHVPASRSPQRGSARERKTSGTCGPRCSDSSRSAGLCESLGSRLKARLGTVGSMEYSQTWKLNRTPAGRSYWAHTASARRTSGNGFGGWPTPNAMPENRGGLQSSPEKAMQRREQGHMLNLDDAACLAGWASPSTRDWKDTPGMATKGINPDGSERTRLDQLPRQAALVTGATSSSSPASTGKRGVLNPELPRWLMALPAEWGSCAPTATPSSRKSRRNSSAPVRSA